MAWSGIRTRFLRAFLLVGFQETLRGEPLPARSHRAVHAVKFIGQNRRRHLRNRNYVHDTFYIDLYNPSHLQHIQTVHVNIRMEEACLHNRI